MDPQLRRQFDLFDAVNEVTATDASDETLTHHKHAADDSSSESGALRLASSQRFEIRRELGRGATAVVFEAWDAQLQQQVTIKKPHEHIVRSPRARARLVREARAAARLHHAGIVPFREIHDNGDEFFLVSPYVAGQDLQELTQEKVPEICQAIKWVQQIADALHYAHENGIIHRDVKPSNVLVNDEGNAMLTDFGLATSTTPACPLLKRVTWWERQPICHRSRPKAIMRKLIDAAMYILWVRYATSC